MAVYFGDRPEWLNQALRSIMNQTLVPQEVILVQDGEINFQLIEIINKYKKKINLKHLILDNNSGLSKALNYGLKKTKFELIARVDSDDINVKNRFEIQYDYMSKNLDVAALGTWISEFKDDPSAEKTVRKVPLRMDEIVQFSKTRSPMNHPSIMFRKKDILDVGCYDENLRNRQDHDLWVRLIQNNKKIVNISEILVNVRVSNDFYKRRSGLKHFIIDYKLTKSFLKIGFINRYEFIYIVLLKFIFRITSRFFASLYYKIFFR